MLIVLSLYFVVVWLIFIKFRWLPWNRAWKTAVFSIASFVALVVIGALKFYTPVSSAAVVQSHTQHIVPIVGGKVIDVSVRDSAAVRKGQELFRLDPEPFQFVLNSSAANLKLAEIRLRDMRTLVERQAAAEATLDRLAAERDLAQAQFDQASYDLEHVVVRAPADGIISMVALQEGEVVNPSTPVMNFMQTNTIGIAAAFAQNGMTLMQAGKRATVVFATAPGEIFETTVARVAPASVQGQLTVQDVYDPAAAIMSTTGTYPVMVTFPSSAPEYLHRPGTEVSVTVFVDEENPINVLAAILQWIGSMLAYI